MCGLPGQPLCGWRETPVLQVNSLCVYIICKQFVYVYHVFRQMYIYMCNNFLNILKDLKRCTCNTVILKNFIYFGIVKNFK